VRSDVRIIFWRLISAALFCCPILPCTVIRVLFRLVRERAFSCICEAGKPLLRLIPDPRLRSTIHHLNQEERAMEERKYYIRVSGNLVEVSKEVYLVYYRMRRRERFLQEKERKGNTFHFSALDTEDRLGEETIPDLLSPSVESNVEERMTNEKLNEGINNLPPDEADLIHSIYFEKMSERAYAQKVGKAPMTIHNRKVRILSKLLKMIKE